MNNNYEVDVPIEELRYKYLRKHPLEMSSQSSSGIPSNKRSPARLVSDIAIFVAFMILSVIVIFSFASIGRTNYGVWEFVSACGDEISSIADYIIDLAKYGGSLDFILDPLFISSIISILVLLISALVVAISTIVCFILAIVHFSKKNSRKLTNVVLYQASTVLSTYMSFALVKISGINGYSLSPIIGISLGIIALVMIGSSIALFVTNKTATKATRKRWISNMISACASIVAIIILANANLGAVITTIVTVVLTPSAIELNETTIGFLLIAVAGILYTCFFSSIKGGASSSLKFLATYEDPSVDAKTKDYSPLSSSIASVVLGGITIALLFASSTMLNTEFFSLDYEPLLLIGLFLMIGTIVSSAIIKSLSKETYYNADNYYQADGNAQENFAVGNDENQYTDNSYATEYKPTPTKEPIKMPKPTSQPIKMPRPKPVAPAEAPVEAPVETPAEAPVETPAEALSPTPKPKIVIKIVTPKQ